MDGGHILVVEDEADIRDMLAFALGRAGYQVTNVNDAEDALQQLPQVEPDLVLIDWMLPNMSGLALAKSLRQSRPDLPLIMLTARSEETDKLSSFEHGVDDYITKPFSPRELIARMKAVLRRSSVPAGEHIEYSKLRLDTHAHKLFIEEVEVHLGLTEFRLLEFLLRHPEQAFSRRQLLQQVWGRSAFVEERTVDVHILRLRKALKPFGLKHWIHTVHGIGYRCSPQEEAAS